MRITFSGTLAGYTLLIPKSRGRADLLKPPESGPAREDKAGLHAASRTARSSLGRSPNLYVARDGCNRRDH